MISQRTHDAVRAWSLGLSLGCVAVFVAPTLAQGRLGSSLLAVAIAVVFAAGLLGFLDPQNPLRVAGSIFLGVLVFVCGRILYDEVTGRFHHSAPLGELGIAVAAGLLPALLGAFAASSLRKTLTARKFP